MLRAPETLDEAIEFHQSNNEVCKMWFVWMPDGSHSGYFSTRPDAVEHAMTVWPTLKEEN